jgi:hypothetical protein
MISSSPGLRKATGRFFAEVAAIERFFAGGKVVAASSLLFRPRVVAFFGADDKKDASFFAASAGPGVTVGAEAAAAAAAAATDNLADLAPFLCFLPIFPISLMLSVDLTPETSSNRLNYVIVL